MPYYIGRCVGVDADCADVPYSTGLRDGAGAVCVGGPYSIGLRGGAGAVCVGGPYSIGPSLRPNYTQTVNAQNRIITYII